MIDTTGATEAVGAGAGSPVGNERYHQIQWALSDKGKRHINMVWEVTQACIALAVTGVGLYASLAGIQSDSLNNTLFLVIGFYFGRTNHARPTTIYKGQP